jgi:hypothetical protein
MEMKMVFCRPVLAIASLFLAGISNAGDFSVHKSDARMLSKTIMRCMSESDSKCLVSQITDPIALDDPIKFGCETAKPNVPETTPEEFVRCLLKRSPANKRKGSLPTLRAVLLDCMSQRSEFVDEYKALRGQKGTWCSFSDGEIIGDKPQIRRISKKEE